jgi:two-component system, NarL family, response regulator LiaR
MPDRTLLRVAIVNDFELVTAGITTLLAPYADRVKVTQYAGTLPPAGVEDVLLFDPFAHAELDLRLLELLSVTGSRVLIYAWPQTQAQIDHALRDGAAGFLSKTASASQIVAALEATLRGDTVTSAVTPGEAPMYAWVGQNHGLTARESEILCLITAGMTNNDMAERMYLSVNSIKSYIRTAYRKIGVDRRAQAVLWGIDHGMRPPTQPHTPSPPLAGPTRAGVTTTAPSSG